MSQLAIEYLQPFIFFSSFLLFYTYRIVRQEGYHHDPSRKYIIAMHPHGLIAVSHLSNVIANPHAFPGLDTCIATVTANFEIPFWREAILGLSAIDARPASVKAALEKGKAVCIVIGGAEESLDARPGHQDLTLNKRLGFVRIAIQEGADLIPVFSFGENDLYEQLVPNPPGSKLRRWQAKMMSTLGFTLPLVAGKTELMGLPSPVPIRKPILTVIGRPIRVDRNPTPTLEEVLSVHSRYVCALHGLYEEFREVAGEDSELVIRDRMSEKELEKVKEKLDVAKWKSDILQQAREQAIEIAQAELDAQALLASIPGQKGIDEAEKQKESEQKVRPTVRDYQYVYARDTLPNYVGDEDWKGANRRNRKKGKKTKVSVGDFGLGHSFDQEPMDAKENTSSLYSSRSEHPDASKADRFKPFVLPQPQFHVRHAQAQVSDLPLPQFGKTSPSHTVLSSQGRGAGGISGPDFQSDYSVFGTEEDPESDYEFDVRPYGLFDPISAVRQNQRSWPLPEAGNAIFSTRSINLFEPDNPFSSGFITAEFKKKNDNKKEDLVTGPVTRNTARKEEKDVTRWADRWNINLRPVPGEGGIGSLAPRYESLYASEIPTWKEKAVKKGIGSNEGSTTGWQSISAENELNPERLGLGVVGLGIGVKPSKSSLEEKANTVKAGKTTKKEKVEKVEKMDKKKKSEVAETQVQESGETPVQESGETPVKKVLAKL